MSFPVLEPFRRRFLPEEGLSLEKEPERELMSWQTINKILGLAMVDVKFAHRLLDNPLSTVQEFSLDLTDAEKEVLRTVQAYDIAELSQILVEKLAHEEPPDGL